MGFLDNLESNLKSLEGNSERELTQRDVERRQSEREQALAAAPHAEQLRKSSFTDELLTHAVRIGHESRTKINMAWVGNTLRLDARDRRLELRPTPAGVVAVFAEGGNETASEQVDMSGNPEALARRWLAE